MFFLKELPTRKMMQRYADRHPEMDVDKLDAALHILRQASHLLRRLEAYFATHGLSQTRFLILIVLDREPDRDHLTMGDLVDRLDVSKPVITTTLRSLQSDGLVTTTACRKDRRAKRIAITEKGRETLHCVLPGYYRLINEEMEPAT
jgi:DNA-binding MarR family transcriptional regulator